MEDYKAKLDQVKVAIGEYFAVLHQLREHELARVDALKANGQDYEAAEAKAIAKGLETALEYADELLPKE